MASSRTFRLPNGLLVVLQHLPHLRSVGLSALVRVGAGDEALADHGLTHLLEHMLFRGSKQYPTSEALLAPFEDAGGLLEAETWRDHTHFCAELTPSGLWPAVAALGSMLSAPRWTGLAHEKRLVTAEILGEMDDQGEEATLHTLSRQAVWPRHALSRRITGTLTSLASFDRRRLAAHHRRHYVGARTVVSLAGPIDLARAPEQLAAAFGQLPPGAPAVPMPPVAFAQAGELTVLPGGGPQLAMQLSYAALPLDHPEQGLDELVANLANDGMLSRLHQALSERTGLVYSYDAGLDVYQSGGTYDLELEVAPRRAARVLEVVHDAWQALAIAGPTKQELARSKARRRFARERLADRPAEAAYEAGLAALFGRDERRSRALIGRATCADVRRAAARLFVHGQNHLLATGPLTAACARALRTAWRAMALGPAHVQKRLPAPRPALAARARRPALCASRELARGPTGLTPCLPPRG